MSVQEMKPIKEGKVREIYDNGDTLIMVATDRISCFDVILDNSSRAFSAAPFATVRIVPSFGFITAL